MAIAREIQETAEGVWIWHAFEESVRTELYSTAVLSADGLVIVDPIDASENVLSRLGKLGPVVAVILTNGNHSRAAARFRERFSAPVFSHPEAVGELTLPVDGILRVDRRVGGSLTVVELPGAGPGEVALWNENGWIHIGDAVINLEDTGLAVLPARYCLDAARLAVSLPQLRQLSFDKATFAHGTPILENARAQIGAIF
jgi:glyoxylase-like metal-dependent hydrolase (beta-lactamase superfamily II)